MIGIGEGLAAAKAGMELTKLARELLKREKIDRDEVLGRLNELQDHLIDAREALSDALEEKRALKSTVEELEGRLKERASLVFVDNVYWKTLGEHSLDGPFCPICWHKETRLSRLNFAQEETYTRHTATGAIKKELMRRYDCSLHMPSVTEFLIKDEIFPYVRIHWAPPSRSPD